MCTLPPLSPSLDSQNAKSLSSLSFLFWRIFEVLSILIRNRTLFSYQSCSIQTYDQSRVPRGTPNSPAGRARSAILRSFWFGTSHRTDPCSQSHTLWDRVSLENNKSKSPSVSHVCLDKNHGVMPSSNLTQWRYHDVGMTRTMNFLNSVWSTEAKSLWNVKNIH